MMNKIRNVLTNTFGLKHILRSLNSRNYRLFFAGQGISLIGTWMQQVAMSWLVYRLTNSPFLLGFVGFVSQLPIFILPLFAGVLADRMNKHRMLIIIQSAAMVQAFILSILIFTNLIEVWHIFVLGFMLGIVNAFDIPVRQSFVYEMVDKKEDLSNAIALNSSLVNMGRLIGPSIGGILISALGEGACFLINGISYMAVIAALFAMKLKTKEKVTQKNENILKGLKDGFKYVFGFPPIRSILLLLSVVSLIGMPFQLLMPVFARDILHGGPQILGFLTAATGIGSIVGAFRLASRKSVLGLGKVIYVSALIFGTGLILFSQSTIIWLSVVLLLIVGFGMISQLASSNTVLQTIADDDKRGRVMSFYTLGFRGMSPFGSLLSGSIAGAIGAPNTILIGGITCIVNALFFASKLKYLHSLVKPVYEKKGIIDSEII